MKRCSSCFYFLKDEDEDKESGMCLHIGVFKGVDRYSLHWRVGHPDSLVEKSERIEVPPYFGCVRHLEIDPTATRKKEARE